MNVWLAMSYLGHVHHSTAAGWFDTLDDGSRLFFCRFTQLSLLRLLSTAAVMGADETLSQPEAWRAYDRWLQDDRISLLAEPAEIEAAFRGFARSPRPAPKDWADSYLAAFAQSAGLSLVTFDQKLARRIKGAICLRT